MRGWQQIGDSNQADGWAAKAEAEAVICFDSAFSSREMKTAIHVPIVLSKPSFSGQASTWTSLRRKARYCPSLCTILVVLSLLVAFLLVRAVLAHFDRRSSIPACPECFESGVDS
ncbi:hypothetical protein M3Y99_01557700 [Aphelenchoides fujianensis]|nr:hypothetical protein M3Y99_01557700 [Aphelenchoides fujianensis]